MENNKKTTIAIAIGILCIIGVIISSTYAYWQITRTQETPNDIVAACLSLDLQDKSAAIDLDNAWPISDKEASNLTGYTFTVINNCDEEINYIVGLNRVEESNYLQDSSVKVRIDNNSSFIYGDLSEIEYNDSDNVEYTARVARQISIETIGALSTNEHTIRIWVSEDAPVTEQSNTFEGQVFITGGQGINISELERCFAVGNDGRILDYNYECGSDIVVPATVGGIKVKTIDSSSLSGENYKAIYTINKNDSSEKFYSYVKDEETLQMFYNMMKYDLCSDINNCNIEEEVAKYYTIIVGPEGYNSIDWDIYEIDEIEGTNISETNFDGESLNKSITSLDLSEAIYLEEIGSSAVERSYQSDTKIDDTCVENTSSGKAYLCYGNLEELILPQNGNLITIGNSAFANNKLTEIIIPSSVESIGNYAFENNAITSFIIEDTEENPSHLTNIGSYAFANNRISELIIPKSVTTIGAYIFKGEFVKIQVTIKRDAYDKDTMNFDPNWNVTKVNSDGSKTFTGVGYNSEYVG